jgi:hypothetical protein
MKNKVKCELVFSLINISALLYFMFVATLSYYNRQVNFKEESRVNSVRHELAILIRGMADEETDKLHKDVYNNEANELDKPL